MTEINSFNVAWSPKKDKNHRIITLDQAMLINAVIETYENNC